MRLLKVFHIYTNTDQVYFMIGHLLYDFKHLIAITKNL